MNFNKDLVATANKKPLYADITNFLKLSAVLCTTLEFDELMSLFSTHIKQWVPHSGYIFKHAELGLNISSGIKTTQQFNYDIELENRYLGTLIIMRSKPFSAAEFDNLESQLHYLVHPLRNASLYYQTKQMAYTDSLTKTNNRAAFNDRIVSAINQSHRKSDHLSMIFLDIDYFKSLNDRYGHDCGDQALFSVAQGIKDCVRCNDSVFRYGGEEFVVLLNGANSQNAESLAERIRSHIESKLFNYAGTDIKITVSLGISTFMGNDNRDSFVKRADQALYQAKQDGRNQIRSY